MKIKLTLIIIFILTVLLVISSSALADSEPLSAKETSPVPSDAPVKIYVCGEELECTGAYIVQGVTYAPFRAVAEKLGGKVRWTGSEGTSESLGLKISVRPWEHYFTANGRYFYAGDGCRMKNGRIFVPVRALGKCFGAKVSWSKSERAVYIGDPTEPLSAPDYDKEDFKWLSRIIYAEASGESIEGKIAVGNVVMNRVRSEWYPSSVKGVVFDKRSGIQFTPAYTCAMNYASEEAEVAAALALEGVDIVGESLYFNSVKIKNTSWAGRNRTVIAEIGNHCFYA